jgi:hypothetical protein
MKQTVGPTHTQMPKLYDDCNAWNKAILYAGTNQSLEDRYSVWGQFSQLLLKRPFSSARIITAHFGVARDLVKMIFARELGLKRYSRQWLPNL